jgi:hypothetical protein
VGAGREIPAEAVVTGAIVVGVVVGVVVASGDDVVGCPVAGTLVVVGTLVNVAGMAFVDEHPAAVTRTRATTSGRRITAATFHSRPLDARHGAGAGAGSMSHMEIACVRRQG